MFAAALVLLLPVCLITAAVTDLREMKIPNWISLVLVAGFLIAAPLMHLSLASFGWHLLAAAIVFGVCFGLFAINVMGGGDAKLLTAAALWFGFNPSLLSFVLYVAYAGGVLTLLILMLRSQASRVLALGLPFPHSIMHAKKIPYGVAICIGGLLAATQSPIVVSALHTLR